MRVSREGIFLKTNTFIIGKNIRKNRNLPPKKNPGYAPAKGHETEAGNDKILTINKILILGFC